MSVTRSMRGPGRAGWAVALGLLAAATVSSPAVAAGGPRYARMAPLSQYLIASRTEEIDLARSAAPASVADHADVLVLGARGYETAVKGTNGFVCLVGRSWDLSFADPQFWNPKIRSPQCDNATSARSVLPRYLARTRWVLAGVSTAEMQKREAAEWASGALRAPAPGAMCYMMSKRGYLNDDVHGPWHPHVMFFAPRTDDAAWGANLTGSPVAADSTAYAHTTIFMVVVANWSDGTPGPPRP